MLFQISLGVDLRENELCLVCLKASSRGFQIFGHAVYPFEENIAHEEKGNVVLSLIQGFLQKVGVSPTSVFLGIPRNTAILRYLTFPISLKENLRESLGYEMEKHVPFSSEDVYFDFQTISEDKEAGLLKLLLVVVKKQSIATLLEIAGSLKAGISGIEISSTALVDFFARLDKSNNAISKAFVYWGKDDIEVGFIKDGMLRYSRSLSSDGNLHSAISTELGRMRREFGEPDEPLNTLFCGSEADVPLPKDCYDTNGINLHLVDISEAQIPSANLIAAYGLALKGIWKTPININLMPPSFRKKPSKLKFYTMFGLTFLILLGAVAWGGGIFLQHQWTLGRLEGEITRLGSQLKKIEGIKDEKLSLEDRINYLNTVRRGGLPVLEVLRELSDRIPEDAWITRFDFSEKGVQIEGEAASASELIPLLEASPMFGGVAFLSAITRINDGKERFRIGLNLK